nr:A disintegrin and metalloproteinase with thrombospondin motifs 7-like [Biomphalaria glabrata]
MCRTNGKSCSVIEDRKEDRYSISTSQTVAHELAHGARIGFCQEIIVKCSSADCSFEESFRSSKENRDGQKRGFREINLRMVSFVRPIGPGHSALLNFCQHTNSPPPISETSYQSVMHTIGLVSKKVAEESMEKAARKVKQKKQVCINGQCVSDPYAPQIDENCAFGDRPSYSCSVYINDFMGNCYSTLGYRACCDTCNTMSRPVKGCEYGDRIIDCTKDHCLNSQVDCCGTCNYGTPFTPTYSTRRSTPERLATTVNPLVLFTSIKDCEQGDQDLRPELCTNFSVCLIQPTQCCHYCSSYYTSATTSTTTTRPLITSTSPKTSRQCIVLCEATFNLRPALDELSTMARGDSSVHMIIQKEWQCSIAFEKAFDHPIKREKVMTVQIHELHLVQYSQVQWEVAQLNPLQSSPVGSRPVESITVKSSVKSPS